MICNERNTSSAWKEWINATMATMKWIDEAVEPGATNEGDSGPSDDDETSHVKRKIAKSDLSRSILRISSDHSDLHTENFSFEIVVIYRLTDI